MTSPPAVTSNNLDWLIKVGDKYLLPLVRCTMKHCRGYIQSHSSIIGLTININLNFSLYLYLSLTKNHGVDFFQNYFKVWICLHENTFWFSMLIHRLFINAILSVVILTTKILFRLSKSITSASKKVVTLTNLALTLKTTSILSKSVIHAFRRQIIMDFRQSSLLVFVMSTYLIRQLMYYYHL